jgi:hypothetical protein
MYLLTNVSQPTRVASISGVNVMLYRMVQKKRTNAAFVNHLLHLRIDKTVYIALNKLGN